MKLTAFTPACSRPEAWALSEKYMARQTRPPDQWIVVDDGDPPSVCTMGQKYVYMPQFRGKGSLSKKVRFLIKSGLVTGDAIVIWENDDWYAPTYLETMEKWLTTYELVGEGHSLYYNVQMRFHYEHGNMQHSSFCSTAIRRECWPQLERASLSDDPFVDWRLWQTSRSRKKVFDPNTHGYGRQVFNIKAMPGIPGYGSGHTAKDKTGQIDADLSYLISQIGEDAYDYEQFGVGFAPVVKPFPHIDRSECGRAHGNNWMKWLQQFRDQPVCGLEIGTFKGESAEWMMENICTHEESRYFCIDRYEPYVEFPTTDFAALKQEAETRIARFAPKGQLFVGCSNTILRHWDESNVDFVYVDGAHDAQNVLRDAVMAWELLNVGGVMIFDDVNWGNPTKPLDRPLIALDAFIHCYQLQLEVLGRGAQLAVRKLA